MLKRIEISDRALIEQLRMKYQRTNNSHSFNALFVWRDVVGDKVYLQEDVYSLNYTAKGENTWIFPCGSEAAGKKFIDANMDGKDFCLCFLNEEDIEFIKREYPGRFSICPDENNYEYMYDLAEHVELKNGDYKAVRKKLHRVAKKYSGLTVEEITRDNIGLVRKLTETWKQKNHSIGELAGFCRETELTAIDNFSGLGYEGFILRVNGEPYGFRMGYRLTGEIWDDAIENSCNSDKELGVYLFFEVCRRLQGKGYKYIDTEEDGGIEGLRNRKISLHPDFRQKLFTARLLQ